MTTETPLQLNPCYWHLRWPDIHSGYRSGTRAVRRCCRNNRIGLLTTSREVGVQSAPKL